MSLARITKFFNRFRNETNQESELNGNLRLVKKYSNFIKNLVMLITNC